MTPDELAFDLVCNGANSTSTSQAFVNFREKKYIVQWPDVYDRAKLFMEGYHNIDDAILTPILCLNSIEGVETQYCCSGHGPEFNHAYIMFRSITDEVRGKMKSLVCWHQEPDELERDVYRMNKPNGSFAIWAMALQELYNALKDVTHKFERYKIIETFEGKRQIVPIDFEFEGEIPAPKHLD